MSFSIRAARAIQRAGVGPRNVMSRLTPHLPAVSNAQGAIGGPLAVPRVRGTCGRWRSDVTHTEDQRTEETSRIPGPMHGGEKFVMLFTCTVCETRSAKQITKQAFNEGVVLVRCSGCENLHLVADRLGYFEDESIDIWDIMRERGEDIRTLRVNAAPRSTASSCGHSHHHHHHHGHHHHGDQEGTETGASKSAPTTLDNLDPNDPLSQAILQELQQGVTELSAHDMEVLLSPTKSVRQSTEKGTESTETE